MRDRDRGGKSATFTIGQADITAMRPGDGP
jgi:hypothetical protein